MVPIDLNLRPSECIHVIFDTQHKVTDLIVIVSYCEIEWQDKSAISYDACCWRGGAVLLLKQQSLLLRLHPNTVNCFH